MRRALRIVNVLIALTALASGLAVLGSTVLDPSYRAHYRDAVWFVLAYVALQAWIVVAFARDGWLVPWIAAAKAVAAWLFLLTFAQVGRFWMVWTPARYVYQLFDWGPGASIVLYAFVFLGRGTFNTLNAFYFTSHWWGPLRHRRPLVGRLVTAVPIAIAVLCIWTFFELVRLDHRTFSPEAHEIARLVYTELDCDTVRARDGRTSTDVRQRGDRRYVVRVSYGCADTQVIVQDPDGRIGTASGPRPECCG